MILLQIEVQAQNQSKYIQGKIIDAETQQAIPFVHIYLKPNGNTTISWADGSFKLAINNTKQAKYLEISHVSYQTVRLDLDTLTNPTALHITLQLRNDLLKGTEVSALGAASIVKEAYNRIPQNYLKQATYLQGFIREFDRNTNAGYQYFTESFVELEQPAYADKQKNTRIHLIEMRKKKYVNLNKNQETFGMSKSFLDEADFVFIREEFLNPKKMDVYRYAFLDEIIFENRQAYLIRFSPNSKQANYKGTLIIDKENFTIWEIDCELTDNGLNDIITNILGIKTTSGQVKTKYAYSDAGAYLLHTWTQFKRIDKVAKDTLAFTIEYANRELLQNRTQTFDYADLLQNQELLILKEQKAENKSFWEDNSILIPDSTNMTTLFYDKKAQTDVAEIQFEAPKDSIAKKKKKTRYIHLGLVTNFIPMLASDYTFSFNNLASNVNFTKDSNFEAWNNSWGFLSNSIVDLGKSYQFNFGVSSTLGKRTASQWHMGLNKSFHLSNQKKRPFHINIGFELSYTTIRHKLGNANVENGSISINNKTINADKIRISLVNQGLRLSPKIDFNLELHRYLSLNLGGQLPLHLLSTDRVSFRSVGKFFGKQATLPLNDNETDFKVNQNETNTIPLKDFLIGIRVGLIYKIPVF